MLCNKNMKEVYCIHRQWEDFQTYEWRDWLIIEEYYNVIILSLSTITKTVALIIFMQEKGATCCCTWSSQSVN